MPTDAVQPRPEAAGPSAAPEAPTPQARYFIGLRPAPAIRTRLHRLALRLAERSDGRPVAAARIHLTLAFLGQMPRALEPDVLALLRAQAAPGALRLERLGRFGPRLHWIGPSETPEWLAALSESTRAGLDALGTSYDRTPLRPHVTLVRSARKPLPATPAPAIEFGPSTLMLVESMPTRPGGHYRWIAPFDRHQTVMPQS